MTRHEADDHAALLEEWLTGAQDPRTGFDSSELAGCDECRSEVEAHLALLDDLERLGRLEREGMAAAAELDVEPGRAEAVLRAHIEGTAARSTTRGPARRTLRWGWLAAAALVLVAGLRLVLGPGADDGARDNRGGVLLGGDAELTHPRGAVDAFAPFAWEVERPPGGYFLVRVTALDETGGARFEERSPRLEEPTWSPDTTGWPDEIRWTLEVYRGTGFGTVLGAYEATARRTGP
jgi:hypothetical protein